MFILLVNISGLCFACGLISDYLCSVMALVDYSSSDDEHDSEIYQSSILPPFTRDFDGDRVRFLDPHNFSLSDGRVRGFAHIHGNWAACVFIPGIYPFYIV